MSPKMLRLLQWVLPAEFVRRVAEPAYNDLLASRLERGRPAVGFLAGLQFVLECMWAALPRAIFRVRRSRILTAALAAVVVMLVIARERMAYHAGYGPQPHAAESGRAR